MRHARRPARPKPEIRVDLADAIEPDDLDALIRALARDAARAAWAAADKDGAGASDMSLNGARPRRAPRN